ncbi:MAG: acetyl-CoA C-acyltransferase, partial [Actinomycetota bacterium]|nr:acetyl-CoA C-acyltransferase [Actinomycetota bacterium]
MSEAFICDAVRTPIGRYGGSLAAVRPDDLAALTLATLVDRNPGVDWAATDDVILGCANQAGEDNRNVARMAVLLAGLPVEVSASTVNRLCGSGMEAVGLAARAIGAGEAELVVAGGVESMSRAPKVMPKATAAFDRSSEIYDSTIGWRFVNPLLVERFGRDEMPATAENVAAEFGISRQDQDAFAVRSQQRAGAAIASGRLGDEIVAVEVAQRRGDPVKVDTDEHPRPDASAEALARLRPLFEGGTVTAGNASGINDGAAAVVVASET